MEALTEDTIQTILSAAKLLTGSRRRQFQAEMALKYCHGSARRDLVRHPVGPAPWLQQPSLRQRLENDLPFSDGIGYNSCDLKEETAWKRSPKIPSGRFYRPPSF